MNTEELINKKVEYLFDMAGDSIDTCYESPRIGLCFKSIVRSELKELCALYEEEIKEILAERKQDMNVILDKHVKAFRDEMEDELS